MTQEVISEASHAGVEVDSLSANEFAVEIEGERVQGIFRVSGLTPFRLDVDGNRLVRLPFRIAKMVQRDANNAFNRWLRDTSRAGDGASRPTRTVAIVAIDDGVETRRWTVNGAFIAEVSYSEFNTGSGELVEEVVLIHYSSIEESWPASGA